MDISPDTEEDLFTSVLRVLDTAFDLLTANKEIFDFWQDAIRQACIGKGVAGGVAVTGAVVCAGSHLMELGSVAVGGASGVAVVGFALFSLKFYHYNKYKEEAAKMKSRTCFPQHS